ncbi:MAG: FkbM family methyltransferase [Candidatus Omnitrophica bacterium]|nr:FkbM family methyltransferase [Candidatus Omnitrophota bacterium]
MLNYILDFYSLIFSRRIFINLNKLLLHLGLRGLGILNCKNFTASGELYFIKTIFICKNPVVLDVGANIGAYSTLVKSFHKEAQIYSFEPHPANFEKLQKIAQTKGFNAFNIGLSNTEGEYPLFDYKDAKGSSHASLYNTVITEIHESESQKTMVKIQRLDDFMDKNKIDKIDLLKIDTEGNEYNVLLGATHLLSTNRIKMIQFEFSQLNMVNRNYMQDFYKLLNGFMFFRILHSGLLPLKKYTSLDYEYFLYQNIIAVKKDYLTEFSDKLFKS